MSKNSWTGSEWNDPKPRMSTRIGIGGLDFVRSPTQDLNPAPNVEPDRDRTIKSTDNIRGNK